MEVLVKDFNCIQSVKLDFKPGFNVLQGPSNSGKSSVIKAIEKCIFNQSGSTNVRQGKDNLLVGIKYKDREVYLTKGKNTKYKVDNEIFEKIGVNQLEQVAEALNIREVVLGGEKVRLNFSNQFSYPFLLDKTPGQLYKFIVDSAESESLSDVLKDMSKDIKDLDKAVIQNEAQMDILNKQKVDLESKLVNSEDILEVSNRILELDSAYTSLNREVELRDKYKNSNSDIEVLKEKASKLTVDKESVARLDVVKDDYVNSVNGSCKYKITYSAVQELRSKLSNFKEVSTANLDKTFEDYEKVKNLVQKYWDIKTEADQIGAHYNTLTNDLDMENKKLEKFSVCPLCGGDLKC